MKVVTVPLRRSIAAAAVALAVPVLTSCGSNFNAPTDQPYNPGVGVNDRTGTVDVLHALIVSGERGSGTVVAGLANDDQENAEQLTGISGSGDDQGITVAPGTVSIPAGGFVQLADEGNFSVTGDQIQAGRFIQLTFAFQRAESITVQVPVVANTQEFSDVPLPSGPVAPSPSESVAPSPSESASPSPSAPAS